MEKHINSTKKQQRHLIQHHRLYSILWMEWNIIATSSYNNVLRKKKKKEYEEEYEQ